MRPRRTRVRSKHALPAQRLGGLGEPPPDLLVHDRAEQNMSPPAAIERLPAAVTDVARIRAAHVGRSSGERRTNESAKALIASVTQMRQMRTWPSSDSKTGGFSSPRLQNEQGPVLLSFIGISPCSALGRSHHRRCADWDGSSFRPLCEPDDRAFVYFCSRGDTGCEKAFVSQCAL